MYATFVAEEHAEFRMTKSTRRRTKCATCGNDYNAKGDNTACPYCSGVKPMPAKKPNKHGFVNYGGDGSKGKRGTLGERLLDAFERGKGKP
jgi:hypothetical protein